jgi:hypothetical protein
VLAEIARSDVDGHTPHPFYSWLATSGAHVGIGMSLCLCRFTRARPRVLVTFAAFWAFKELAFDLRADGYAALTWADSGADLSFAALGFWFARRALRQAGGQPFPNAGNQ